LDQCLSRVVEWCAGFADAGWPPETPDYVLANYVVHLRQVGERSRLYAVVDPKWVKARVFRAATHRAQSPATSLPHPCGDLVRLEKLRAQIVVLRTDDLMEDLRPPGAWRLGRAVHPAHHGTPLRTHQPAG